MKRKLNIQQKKTLKLNDIHNKVIKKCEKVEIEHFLDRWELIKNSNIDKKWNEKQWREKSIEKNLHLKKQSECARI